MQGVARLTLLLQEHARASAGPGGIASLGLTVPQHETEPPVLPNASMNTIHANDKFTFHRPGWRSQAEDFPGWPDVESPPETDRLTKQVLLADDDPGVREILGRVLASEHYRVTLAKSVRQAVAKLASDPPDLVLLDLNMPDRDGWAALRLMNAAHPMLPVIVITARLNQYRQAADLGVDALMEKPLDLAVLLEAVHDLLAETDAERARRLTDPDFKTVFLNPPPPSACERSAVG